MPTASLHYVAPTEQHAPADALAHIGDAAGAGFDGAFLTDRFQPWLPTHGNAPSAWTLAGAASATGIGELTVSAVPGYRMHPATVAQASMTTAALHAGRHTLVLSAGDAIDEHVAGGYWPEGHERVVRMLDAADLIRKLFATVKRRSEVRHAGSTYRLETARLWLEAPERPRLLIWAGGPVTARRAAAICDGIVMTATDAESMRAIIRAAREGAAAAGRDPREVALAAYAQLCWAPTDAEAEAAAVRDWPMAGLRFPRGDIRSPFDVEHLTRAVSLDDIRSRIRVSADAAAHAQDLAALAALGLDTVYVHNVAREQRAWIEAFGDRIRPALKGPRA